MLKLSSILRSDKFYDYGFVLPIPIGMELNENYIVEDLIKLRHLLVGGATGQGKSVFLHSIIATILLSEQIPDELKLVLIDPKQVEFSAYNVLCDFYFQKFEGISNAVISDSKEAKTALDALCDEMERRYTLLRNTECQSIIDYNKSVSEKLPYIVIVIDEYADLAMSEGKSIEQSIVRLAAKAGAVGMHLILSTQRPSAGIITAAIKANFPARVAFKTTNRIDSKTILDTYGAEQLNDRGEILFSFEGNITRLQIAFIDTDEINRTVKCINDYEISRTNESVIIPSEEV